MSQHDKNVSVDKSRSDLEPLPDNLFWKWLVSMGTMATEGGAGLFGVHLHGVMPQALPEASVPPENVHTNPAGKLLRALKMFWEKRSSSKNEVKSGALRPLSTSSEPNTTYTTDPQDLPALVVVLKEQPLVRVEKGPDPSTNYPTDPDQNAMVIHGALMSVTDPELNTNYPTDPDQNLSALFTAISERRSLIITWSAGSS